MNIPTFAVLSRLLKDNTDVTVTFQTPFSACLDEIEIRVRSDRYSYGHVFSMYELRNTHLDPDELIINEIKRGVEEIRKAAAKDASPPNTETG